MQLRHLAHIRTGDKGRIITISITTYQAEDFPLLESALSIDRVADHLRSLLDTAQSVQRYSLPQLHALNFVLHRPLSQSVTSSLALDTHGKCLGSALLALDLTPI